MAVKKRMVLDIGCSNIHIIQGKFDGTHIFIEKSAVFKTPPNCLIDGKIEDPVPLIQVIMEKIAANKFRTKNVIVTIHSSAAIIREFIIPTANTREETTKLVKHEMEQFFPESQTEYVIEYKVLENVTEGEKKKQKIRAAAIPKNIVDDYYSLIKDMRLRPKALDIYSNCISKLASLNFTVNDEENSPPGTIALIDAGGENTIIHIVKNSNLILSRTINLGGRNFDTSIASTFNISLEDAQKKKTTELNLDPSRMDTGENEIYESVSIFLSRWVDEITKVFQYYLSRGNSNIIDAVYLYGGSSNIKGLSKYLEEVYSIKTSKLEKISSVKFHEEINDRCCEYFLNTAGAIIRL